MLRRPPEAGRVLTSAMATTARMDSLGIEKHVGGQKIRDKQGQKPTGDFVAAELEPAGSAEAIGCQLAWDGYVPWIGDTIIY